MPYSFVQTSTLLLLFFIFTNCGLMSSSKENGSATAETVNDAAPAIAIPTSNRGSSQIFTQPLFSNSGNEAFITEIGYFNHPQTRYYKIIEKQKLLNTFLTDLNTSAQALNNKDQKIISEWISNIKTSYIDFNQSNLLFLPLLRETDCLLSTTIEDINNSTLITINEESITCDLKPLYHALFFKIAKNIEEIKVNLFGIESLLPNNEY